MSERRVGGQAIQRRPDFLAVWKRLECVEAWIGQGMSAPMVARKMTRPEPDGFGMNRITANRYVRSVLARLQQDVVVEPSESKRARMASFWRAQIDRSLNRTRTVVSDDGTRTVQVIEADLRSANQAGLALQQLEGLVPK